MSNAYQRPGPIATLIPGLLLSMAADAGSASLLGIDTEYSLTANYAAAMRLEKPAPGIIDAPGKPDVPVAEFMKYPESNQYDDASRNFEQYDLVNNRISLIGDIEFMWRDYGLLLRGDVFYDAVYHGRNKHDAPDRINTTQDPFNSFTEDAEKFAGERARLLDAYIYGNFYIGDTMTLNLRLGRHIAAWGQSLFFSGVALTQSTADATRASVPGADVKSILLPTNQLSFRFSVSDRVTLLGQYHLEFKPFELNPVGEFYSPADVIGPGREMIYGLRNPLHPDVLAQADITNPQDLAGVVQTIDQALLDGRGNTAALQNLLTALPIDVLPSVFLPVAGSNPLNAPEGLNVQYVGDIEPDSDEHQYSLGITYALTDTTEIGAYYLRYHQKTPVVLLNFGPLTVIPEQQVAGIGIFPGLTTDDLGINVPATYNVGYFDNVDMYALSISTLVGSVNVGAEVIRRDGIDTLVDVPNGVNGPLPTPTRATSTQVLINAISVFRPPWYFDSIALVGEVGWVGVDDQQPQISKEGDTEGAYFDDLTFDKDAYAVAALALLDRGNIFSGWDLQVPISYAHAIKGRSSLNGAFGSLFDQDDIRIGIGFNFTRLQTLTLGLSYSGFIGASPHFDKRPLQDRDTLGLSVKYRFF